jgi:glycosyltransferase involved in cell wall biosynthesis
MKILILSPFVPWPLNQGGKIRVFNIVKYLSRRHNVSLACLEERKVSDYGPLSGMCREVVCVERRRNLPVDSARFLMWTTPFNFVRFSSGRFRERLQDLLKREKFDIVQIEFTLLWQYADIFKGLPVVLDVHNIEADIINGIGSRCVNPAKKMLYRLEEEKLKVRERRAWRECRHCFTVSDSEMKKIGSLTGREERMSAVPNGVDLERFTFVPRTEPENRILLLGGMDYIPNLDAANYFLSKIFPSILSKMPDVQIDLVGRELWRIAERKSLKAVEFHENVPDVLPFFRGADVLAVSLRYGAGTRIKILEAMAAGLPVVTTSKGCEGIDVRHGEHVLIADSPESFASSVRKVIEDKGVRGRLVYNARALVEKRYSWERIVEEMEKVYSGILQI